ncbi:MAG TPA: acyl-CoA dehydrogenase family protein [Haliangium sp.]|nr:acyl-CoA dehydrogenase family protein [Haliangium sp.]
MYPEPARSSIDGQILERARRAAAEIAPRAHEIEAARRLPPAVVDALVQAGVFKLLVPRAHGGAEASLATLMAVLDEIAAADGSAGWCAMIGASSGLMCGFLPDDVAREVYGPDGAITCGVFAPMGRAVPVAGGFRVSGRWTFASGCQHSTWCMGSAIVTGDGAGEVSPGGAPDVRCMLFHVSEIRIIDTWDTSGLRGTGSHDFVADDVLVPAGRSFSLLGSRHALAAYRSAFFGGLAAGVAAVALGIARAAIDAFVALARDKRPAGSRRSIAHRELTQLSIARAEARVRAARAFLLDAVETAAAASATGEATIEQRALLRLAACHAATEAASAVDLVYEAGGGSSIYATSPLQRCFRDVHTATQHVMVGSAAATQVGRILLGVESDLSTL